MQISASLSPLSVYLSEVGRHPLLDPAEEKQLTLDFHRTRDGRIAQKLVASNLRFVVKMAMQYRRYGVPLADLIQEGNLGLMRAVEKFDPRRGVRLISYAVWWIRAHIQSFLLRSWSLVKLGTTQVQRRLFFSLARAKREIERLSGPGDSLDEIDELARRFGVKPQEIAEMEQRMAGRDFSLDTPSKDDGRPLLNLVAGATQPADEKVAEAEISRLLSARVAESMTRLDSRERYIIEHRVLADEQTTFQELGDHFGFSRERARQLETKAKEKLQAFLTKSLFDPRSGSFPGQKISDLLN